MLRVVEIKQCDHCGAQFRKRTRSGTDANRYCSVECFYEARHEAAEASTLRNELRIEARRHKICRVCRRPFVATHGTQRLCSDECRRQKNIEQCQKYAAEHLPGDRSPRPCHECGETFEPTYGDKRRKFCSKNCATRFHSTAWARPPGTNGAPDGPVCWL